MGLRTYPKISVYGPGPQQFATNPIFDLLEMPMPSTSLRKDERELRESLIALEVIDKSGREAEFDALVKVAALACGVPIALVAIIDGDRVWFKANVGLDGITEAPMLASFCEQAVQGAGVFEVSDASLDERFASHFTVCGSPGIRFYAGVPLRLSKGETLGTLCVLGLLPHKLQDTQRTILRNLGVVASSALEQRRAGAQARTTALQLVSSEARFKSLTEGAPLGVFQADAQGECTYSNPRLQDMFGLSFDECLGRGWTKSIHPLDRSPVFNRWLACSRRGEAFDADFRLLRPDLSMREVRMRSQPLFNDRNILVGHVGSVSDVTERNQLKASLRRTGRLANVGGWEVDLRTRKVSWSEQTRVLHGVDDEFEPTFETALEFFPPEARTEMLAAVQRGADNGIPWDVEVPFVTANGNYRWVRAMGEPEFENGRPVKLVGALQDITAQRERQLALSREQAARREIEEHARQTGVLLKERSEMLDVLAHEVRQPLSNASAALQGVAMALAESGGPVASARLVRAQRVLGQVLSRIDNNLAVATLLARPEAVQRHDGEIDIPISLAQGDMAEDQRGRIRLTRNTATRTVSMDINLMRLALRNLLANALRYGPLDSVVEVRISDSDEPLGLIIEVANRGPRIAEEVALHLFERGRRSQGESRLAHGLGLGLYIVRRVMELHGGSVQLSENSETSVAFRLTLVQPADN